jgi:cytochrome P450
LLLLTLLLLLLTLLLLLRRLLLLTLLLLPRLRWNHSPRWRRKRLRRRSYQYLRKLFQDFHSHEKTDLPIVVLQLSE